jgi:DNA-binding GntR family transcriptional regulator
MKIIATQPTLVAQVHDAIVTEIAERNLPGERIIQEQLAQGLGVSRQPVQQALLLLRREGVLVEAAGRGLVVAPMEPESVRNLYDVRAKSVCRILNSFVPGSRNRFYSCPAWPSPPRLGRCCNG